MRIDTISEPRQRGINQMPELEIPRFLETIVDQEWIKRSFSTGLHTNSAVDSLRK